MQLAYNHSRNVRFVERAERIPIEDFISVSLFGSSEKYTAFCKNISASGFLIEDEELPFKLNTLLEFYMHNLDLDRSIKLVGKVVRLEKTNEGKFLYGVQFSFLDHTQLSHWAEFISVLAPKE